MNEVKIDRSNKAAARAGTIVGRIIGALVVLATVALFGSMFIWGMVSMWRMILG